MRRFAVILATLALGVGVTSTARAEGPIAAGPALQAGQQVMALTLLDGWRSQVELAPKRVRLPEHATQAEQEAPGEALTMYVERVWSQARVYRRPGGAEVILRAKF